MALDVKYLRGTVAQYKAYLANTKDPNYVGTQKIVDTTYYLIYEHVIGVATIGYPLLYIGQVLLSEAANINVLSQNIVDMDIEITQLKQDVENLKQNGGGGGEHPIISIDKSLMPTIEEDSKTIVVLTDLDANDHSLTPTYGIAATKEYVDTYFLRKDKLISTDENGESTSIKINTTQEGEINVTLEWGNIKDATE